MHPIVTDQPEIRVRAKEEFRLLEGHPWAFSNELLEVPKMIPAGTIVTLIREKGGSAIGQAFFNPHSLIAARIITRDGGEEITDNFFEKRLREAAARRELLLTRRNAARMVNGEGDHLPGLIIDRFGDIIAFQTLSAGWEMRKDLLIRLIQKVFAPATIIEKNNSHLRKLEGLPMIEGVVSGTETATTIHDAAGTRFEIDVLTGQKTGFFLDQMENRTRLRDLIRPGSTVLDLFTNEGGFALNAALAGAAEVRAVDVSGAALAKLQRNAEINGVAERITTLEADCFDYLSSASERHDVVIVDPPALTRSKKELPAARKGYVALNTNALRLVKPGGVMVTASCSHHMAPDMFADVIREAGRRSGRTVSILETRAAGIDHPVLAIMRETQYLKVFILGVR